jgi:LPS export ABC transporter protein LptC
LTWERDKKIIFEDMKSPSVYPFFILLIFSCKLNYDSSVSDVFSESVPSSVLYEVQQVEVKNGTPKTSFSAQEAKIWDKREDTELFSVEFLEYDGNKEVVTNGTADYLILNNNNDASIEGNVRGYSVRNEASIKAEELSWQDETRELSSTDDDVVEITLDGGTELRGSGFSADFYTNTMGFSSRVEGDIETGSENE